MKRILIPALASLIFTSASLPALAQTATPSSNTTTSTPSGSRKDVRATGAVVREERAATRAARLDARKQAIVDRILAHAKRMLERANRRIARLDAIWKRVVMRMDRLRASGKDLSSLDSLVTDVSTKRQKAVDAVIAAQATVDSLADSNEPKTAVTTFRTQFKAVIDALKAYHQAIVAVIRSLKGMSPRTAGGTTPTLTPAVTSTPSPTG